MHNLALSYRYARTQAQPTAGPCAPSRPGRPRAAVRAVGRFRAPEPGHAGAGTPGKATMGRCTHRAGASSLRPPHPVAIAVKTRPGRFCGLELPCPPSASPEQLRGVELPGYWEFPGVKRTRDRAFLGLAVGPPPTLWVGPQKPPGPLRPRARRWGLLLRPCGSGCAGRPCGQLLPLARLTWPWRPVASAALGRRSPLALRFSLRRCAVVRVSSRVWGPGPLRVHKEGGFGRGLLPRDFRVIFQ